jgi:redox-sensitive bicupin YhaK (pirin superfamily)
MEGKMIQVRKSEDRGRANYGWLDTKYTFSFNTYYDPKHVHFRSLRVINDDIVAGGQGFGMHPHQDMEILTWVLDGAVEHKDTTGGGGVIRPGELQYMSAGKGLMHSEFNASKTEPVRLLQIWILPDKKGVEPNYGQMAFTPEQLSGRLAEVASPDPKEGGARIHQNAKMFVSRLSDGQEVTHDLAEGRHAWLQIAKGNVELNGVALKEGDGARVSEETVLKIRSAGPSEVLLFDLA